MAKFPFKFENSSQDGPTRWEIHSGFKYRKWNSPLSANVLPWTWDELRQIGTALSPSRATSGKRWKQILASLMSQLGKISPLISGGNIPRWKNPESQRELSGRTSRAQGKHEHKNLKQHFHWRPCFITKLRSSIFGQKAKKINHSRCRRAWMGRFVRERHVATTRSRLILSDCKKNRSWEDASQVPRRSVGWGTWLGRCRH